MPIPDFNDYGLLPSGIFDCVESEIVDRYCQNNQNRDQIWGLFKQFIQSPKPFNLPDHIYIDGGFTSDKAATKDIDVVIDISHLDDANAFKAYAWLASNKSSLMTTYKVDCWLKHHVITNDLVSFFQYVKTDEALARGLPNGEKKGLLRMMF